MSMSEKGVNAFVEELAIPGLAPGAVQGLSLVGAIAGAMSRAAGPSTSGNELLLALTRSLEAAGENDQQAYWDESQRKMGDWRRKTPLAVADLCRQIALISDAMTSENPIDARVGKLIAVASTAACEIIAEANEPKPTSGFSIPAAWQQDLHLLDIAHSEGSWLEATDGTTYLDASSGLWNVPLGHGHPDPLSGFLSQVSLAAVTNPFLQTAPILRRLSNKILDLCQMQGGGVFLCSSGSEAVETALRFGLATIDENSPVWALPGAFHGATMGASMLTEYETLWREFSRLPRFVKHAAPSKWGATGLGFVEPIRIGAGVRRVEEVESLIAFKERGGVIVADEIASGIGRTYWPLASHVVGVPHDILVLGKGLANGLVPVSCVVVSQEMLSRLSDKGTDFGHTHSNHLGAAGAVESTLTALNYIDHKRFSDDLEMMMGDLPCKTFTEGATGAIILGRSAPRALVDEVCRSEGIILHLPTVSSALDRLIVAPPLTTDHHGLTELGCRLKRATDKIETLL